MPFVASGATWKVPLPKLVVWKLKLAIWLALFESCSRPVDES
jgi:hypothetical protein